MLEAEWKKAAPDKPCRYFNNRRSYKRSLFFGENLNNIVSMFALFTLVIAAFGLFGLTLFVGKPGLKKLG